MLDRERDAADVHRQRSHTAPQVCHSLSRGVPSGRRGVTLPNPPSLPGAHAPAGVCAPKHVCPRNSAPAAVATTAALATSSTVAVSRGARQPSRHTSCRQPPLPSLLLLLLLLSTSPLPVIRADLTRYYGNASYPLDEQLSYCNSVGELYDGIAVDLRHWNASYDTSLDPSAPIATAAGGISREALDLAISRYTTAGGQKGVSLAFYGGVPYLTDEPKLTGLGHHVNILFTYMLVLLDLARQYGSQIPDVEFVIASSDRPLVLTADQAPGLVPPVMRFCSSDEHADIKIPIFHFYTKKYTSKYLAGAEALAQKYPWGQRQPVVFGRFSKYYRYIHPRANSTLRVGARNATICRQESPATLMCPVRAHFMDWAARRHPELLDVKSGPRASLEKHAEYKYLLHLDGQALSSRLEQLLPLRSLVLKEESGYKTFYYHLVRPYEHYIPVWRGGSGPEDVLGAVKWAMAHDKEAERMAAAAQSVALKYLTKRARSCYWLRLFQAYASLQTFTPSPSGKRYVLPVADYLETVGRSWEKGGQLHRIEY